MFGDFFDTVALGKPPKIEIHLDAAESQYDYGEVAYALDMTWYEKYKPTVDVLLSSMIWVFFVWRVFVHLPNIITGVSGDLIGAERMTDDIDRGFRSRKRR